MKSHTLFFILISCFFSFSFTYASREEDGIFALSLEECDVALNTLNLTSSINTIKVINSLKCLEEKIFFSINLSLVDRDIDGENRLLVLYLSHAHLLSYAYDLGIIKEHTDLVKSLDWKVDVFMKAIKQNSTSYLKYADYLYLKLVHGSRKVIHALPILYRKVLLLDKENNEARLKLAMWYIFPSNERTSNFRGMIEKAEEYIEELKMYDKFNAYLMYSIYYMKCYNTQKGFEYLEKANQIFPHHIYVSHLWNNYKKGKIGM